jgi:hypothetical protein
LRGRSAGLSWARGPSSGSATAAARRRSQAERPPPTKGSPTRLETPDERRPEAPTGQARVPRADALGRPVRLRGPHWEARWRPGRRLFVGATAGPAKRPTAGPRIVRRSTPQRSSRPPTRATWRRRPRAPQWRSEEGTGLVPRSISHLCGAGCPIEHSAPNGRQPTPRRSIAGCSSQPLQRSSRNSLQRSSRNSPQGPSGAPGGAHSGGRSATFSPADEGVNGHRFLPGGGHEIPHWRVLSPQRPPRSCPLECDRRSEAEAVGRRGDGANPARGGLAFGSTRVAIKASLAASARGVLGRRFRCATGRLSSAETFLSGRPRQPSGSLEV